jgi:hypothetical protein
MTGDPEFLRREYFHLQDTVEKFDDKALTIKAWSVTFSMAGVGAAFAQHAPVLLLLSALASVLFWLIEGLWKVFQQSYYPRIREIEEDVRTKSLTDISTPSITTSWSAAWHGRNDRRSGLHNVLVWPHVFLPHLVVTVGATAVWLLNRVFAFIPAA